MKTYSRLLKYLKSYWHYCLGALFCMLILAICNIALIPLIGKLSEAIGSRNIGLLNTVALSAIGIYFLRSWAMYGQGYLMSFASQRVVTDLRVHVFKHLQDLSLDFYAQWRTGEVIARAINDIEIVQTALVSSVTEIAPNLITIIGVLGYLIYLNWKLTALAIIIIPILAWVTRQFGQEMHQVSKQAQKKIADISSSLQETISGARTVKSFAMEKQEIKKFRKQSEESFWLSMKQSQINATQIPLMAFIQMIAVMAVVWFGGIEVVNGNIQAANLVAFFGGIALLADPISKIAFINTTVSRALASGERIFEIIDIVPTVKEEKNALALPKIKGRTEFKNVSFRYDQDQPEVLFNINISVDPGETIAIVGPSGAGKTTFVNLIPRFYDPCQGEILIDGHNIKGVKLESLRSQMGIVPQETILFSGTIRENIAYGKNTASQTEIIQAAKMANAHDFIEELQDGYDTYVGERGIMLSGGQRQRVAIARALLKDPRVLIFDEATSALDTESERLVQDAMDRLMQGRTTFVIAHRLSTVQHADRIIVLQDGRIVEQGNHEELLKNDGLYKKLYDLQFKS